MQHDVFLAFHKFGFSLVSFAEIGNSLIKPKSPMVLVDSENEGTPTDLFQDKKYMTMLKNHFG